MNNGSVEDLIAAFRRDSPGAGDALLRRFEPWLKLLARTQLESRFNAKFDPSDVVQLTMLEAVRAFPQFRGTTEAGWMAWLRRILCHVLAHEIRRYQGTQKRDLNREVSLEEDLTAISQCLGDLLPAPESSPSHRAARRDCEAILATVLDRLPEDYRTVLILRHLDGLTHDEVARRMHRNPGAVRMLWVRALTRLRHEIDREELGSTSA